MSARTRTYDLAGPEADYPEWTGGRPRCTYVVCTHMRSGSTLLGEALYHAGGMGCPLEYFHAGFRPAFAARWKTPDLAAYVSALYRHRTDPGGALGVKIFWRDVVELCRERHPQAPEFQVADPETAEPSDALVRQTLDELFPNARYILLSRQDVLRQAISQITARETGVWRQIPDVDDKLPRPAPTYDFETVLANLASIVHCQERWESYFRSAATEPYRIRFEDLASDYDPTVRALLRALARDGEIAPRPPRMRRHEYGHTEVFVRSFLEDVRRRHPAPTRTLAPQAISLTTRVARHPHAVFGRPDGDGLILMSAATGAYFGLDGIGLQVWRALENPHSVGELAESFCARFDVDPERCRVDLLRLVEDLMAEGMLITQST